ncbi:hypothetical protein ACHAW6_013948 [Cyclotella cf. meneghiniana]
MLVLCCNMRVRQFVFMMTGTYSNHSHRSSTKYPRSNSHRHTLNKQHHVKGEATMFDRVGEKSKSRSVAGPTPYHRQESYFPLRKKLSDRKFRWLIYDNNGSFNGWFDWLPLWMRVGPWSLPFVLSLVAFYTALLWFRPTPLEFEPSAIINYEKENEAPYFMGMPKTTAVDLAIFLWGLVVILHAKLTMLSVSAFFISFTGWSWMLITSRAGLEFFVWAFYNRSNQLSTRLATLGSSLRLVTITNATIVCTIWNFVLLPIIYFVSMPPGEKRKNFLKFNFGFFMTNIHGLNLPLAYLNILSDWDCIFILSSVRGRL